MLPALAFLLLVGYIGSVNLTGDADVSIQTFHMHNMCGQRINMIWKSIYTAEIRFTSSPTLENISISHNLGNDEIPYHELESCDLEIESWNFLNRILFYFKELELDENAHIEMLDGPTTDSPSLPGFPPIFGNNETETVLSGVHTTSDRHLTIRYHDSSSHKRNTYFTLVIVSFHEGICNSYEQSCANGHCIMNEIVCNGHNPCGDNSDCLMEQHRPHEVATNVADERHVLIAAIIAISFTIVFIFIGVIVVYKCWIHRKHRRQLPYLSTPGNDRNEAVASSALTTVDFSGTVNEVNAEHSQAPPCYDSLQETKDQPETEELQPEVVTTFECMESDDQNPPEYACVMLHKEMFNLSEMNIAKKSMQDLEVEDT